MEIPHFFKKKKDITPAKSADFANNSGCALEKQEPFDICPQYICERYYYDHQAYMIDHGLAVDFSVTIIQSLFGFDETVYNHGMLFAELNDPQKTGGFEHLWHAVFRLCKEKHIIQSNRDKIPYAKVFNYQIGKLLLDEAKQLVAHKTVNNHTADIVFRSCIATDGFSDFEGYTDFDFLTALSILFIKDAYPDVHTVRANVYFNHGIPLENIPFPVKVESTVDQHFIYGLINGR